jgi:hypothetical protein
VARPPRRRVVSRGPRSPLIEAIANFYYLLPGPYEWERGQSKDLLAALIVPLLGVAGWALASGRLNWLVGRAPYAGWLAWALLLVLALPLWPILPRLAMAGLPTAVLLTGPGEGLVQQLGMPPVLAWGAAGVLGVLLSARLYLFVVLPTLVVCWTLANALTQLASFGASILAGQFGLLALAGVLGALSWLMLLDWRRQAPAVAKPASPKSAPAEPPAASDEPGKPLFRRVSADRVCTLGIVPLRTDRDQREPPSVTLGAKQEANVVLIRDAWAFLQTDDGREGWAEWRVAASG